MVTVTIDIGNQRVKIEQWDNDGFMLGSVYDSVPYEELRKKIETTDISGIIIASVRNDAEEVTEELKSITGCEVIVNFNQEEIEKHYSEKIKYKGRIGADRIAAYVGAQIMLPGPKLVIDAGTAITLDVVDKDGYFCGGNISLGVGKRLEALALSTKQLPMVEDFCNCKSFGDTTLTAIQSGVRNGVSGEVEYSLQLANEQYDVKWVVITGGDGDKIYWPSRRNWKNCLPDSHLVGRGLNYHLRKYYFPEEYNRSNFLPMI